MSERATVVVITYNRRDELRRTLRAMTSLPDAAPIVLADNGSSDGSAAMAEAEFPDVTVVRLPRNLGATARNIAVEQVSTPYVAFCDDDTVWQPGALTTAADVLDEYPGLATVTGRCLVEPTLTEDPLTPELRNSPVPGPDWMPGPTLLGIMAGLTMIRRRAFHEVGGFEPRMWLGGEEELLALDLAAAGWWMCWREDVVIHHRPSTSRDARRRRQLGIRNTLWTLWLRRPVRSALRRSTQIVRSAPADRYTALAVLEAVRSLGWVVRNRVVVPSRVESGLLALEDAQVHSAARRYVG
ncbi:glycosyl transferase [Prescottella equi]|uniref:Glycosyltransferase, group 2 family protein n=2 Tax=Rhodococcus hoagii TaxID=43767 RepID=F1TJF1_RHOHA|nr:glycosyltransferase family 2 protein [Prescottella equi]MCD7049982.1 glycosyltransferase [Rhodococcus sp. BH2-1]GBF13632.1 N-acetylglucosaminyl-diphospho-decaprenol L-rhamnosyltransferase [Rhodococcus sp. Br-6]AVP68912.1 glycosyl transferase [Prescottella equi]EGD24488.1 glycosyltransferase, group 2 family protein [Prescottella equi ATCC 33707]ERN45366.1 putative glycosyltransferase [Prescottella equi NBRC 101255 = C 7]